MHRVHVKTVRRWIHEGKLPAVVSPGGRGFLIPESAIGKYGEEFDSRKDQKKR